MNDGNISGNNSSGVKIGGGSFTMRGGTIYGNTSSKGGGVSVGKGKYVGTFTMQGGTITGNIAKEYGGGVYVEHIYNFIKTGGTITGYNSDQSNGNVVNDGSGIISRRGHAAAYNSAAYRKETSVGPEVKLSCKMHDRLRYGCTGAWDQ